MLDWELYWKLEKEADSQFKLGNYPAGSRILVQARHAIGVDCKTTGEISVPKPKEI